MTKIPTLLPLPLGAGSCLRRAAEQTRLAIIRARPRRIWPTATLALLVLAQALAGPVEAVEPGEMLSDVALEARARHISQQLRCLVCQNQSIDDSAAELARDLRVLVRERLAAGDSDAAVLAFVEARYGEFVLLRPRFAPHTLVLWLTPLLLLAAAAYALRRWFRAHWSAARWAPEGEPLSPAERQRLQELLKGSQGGSSATSCRAASDPWPAPSPAPPPRGPPSA